MNLSRIAQLKKMVEVIKLAEAKVTQSINDLLDSDDVTVEELTKVWDPKGGLKAPGKKFYVEIDLEGDARFVGPMNLRQAKLLKYYTMKEAMDEAGNLVLGPANIIDEAEYKAHLRLMGEDDPMRISLPDYVQENQDFNDFLKNR
jgi:hypothetical protein